MLNVIMLFPKFINSDIIFAISWRPQPTLTLLPGIICLFSRSSSISHLEKFEKFILKVERFYYYGRWINDAVCHLTFRKCPRRERLSLLLEGCPYNFFWDGGKQMWSWIFCWFWSMSNIWNTNSIDGWSLLIRTWNVD